MPDCDGAKLGRRINAGPSCVATPLRLILIDPPVQRSDAEFFGKLFGFCFGFLMKPVRFS